MVENTIASQIKKLRTTKQWTQLQLADKLSVSKQTISNWETGIKVPRMQSLQKLADVFGVKIGEITNASIEEDEENGGKTLSVDEAVDSLRFYHGRPIRDNQKEVLKDVIKGYLDRSSK